MTHSPIPRSGGAILADALIANGADTVFCVPGESYLPFLDAAADRRESLRVVTCRHEGGAAYMAEAFGKLTGRPGVCFVTRGPGACHAAVGVHTAFQDSTPMVLLVGQVERPFRTREAFQEVEYRQMFGPLAKWVAEVDDPARLPEYVARAYAAAVGGRPGPVVLAVPEDMLADVATVPDVGPRPLTLPHPGEDDLARLRLLLSAARRPLAIVGGGGWDAQAADEVRRFLEVNALPVAASFRCQDIIDNDSAVYVGELGTSVSPQLARRVREADLLLVLGARLGEMSTQGYSLVEAPEPRQALIHVYPGAEEIGRVYRPALGIVAAMPAIAKGLLRLEPLGEVPWRAWCEEARSDYENGQIPGACPGDLDMGEVMRVVRERLPPDAIVCNGAGNYTGWVQRFYRYRRFRTQLGPTNGSMGYGLPAALAAKSVYPERTVVAFAGDGCFLMTGQELATAVQHDLDPVILVVNNNMYGTIRMHQEKMYPGRAMATDLVNPDFAALARSFGAHAEVVERTAEFEPAFDRALGAGKVALLELRIDPDAISTRTTLSAIRGQSSK
ncbi:MAG: thiamine pyrophosphate-binding protein [Rhodospirillales bacterium]|nr:thiamine pyrophosphate-binding protein [Rhodospirillales bacterium]